VWDLFIMDSPDEPANRMFSVKSLQIVERLQDIRSQYIYIELFDMRIVEIGGRF